MKNCVSLYLIFRYRLFGIIYNLLSIVNRFSIHKENKILIYDPDHDKHDNTGALYDYLVENGYNQKYIIVHSCRNYKFLRTKAPKNVYFTGKILGIFHFFSSSFVYYRGSTIRIIPSNKQQVIQMWHGSPCKGAPVVPAKKDWINPYYTGFFSASVNFNHIFEDIFSIPEERMILCGHPRTDDLFKPSPDYDFGHYKKIVIWTPTFRKYKWQKYSTKPQLEHDDRLLPIIPTKDFKLVNEYLKKNSVKIVIKLHPMQSLENYNLVEMDHFIFLSDIEFKKRGLELYRFMKQCDAMITDYSSIYWDYMVLNRPIAFTEDDIEEYAVGRGFVMDDPEKYKPGPKLRSIADFYKFIDDLVEGIDDYKEKRKKMNEYGNPVTDGHSCQRALECVGIFK